MPSAHAAATIALTVAMFVAFARGQIRIEVVCLVLISLLALGFHFFPLQEATGQTGIEIAFGGFGHPALITICCLMILGQGLVSTGALEPVSLLLGRIWQRSRLLGMISALTVFGAFSMVINDTPVMVLAMPVLLTLAAKAGVPASQTLMPVNAAVLLGGMTTAIGTSTNLLVVSIAADYGIHIGIFDFTPLALTAVLIALPYLWLVMPRLLPSHRPALEASPRRFFAALHIDTSSSVVDLALDDLQARVGAEIEIGGVARGEMDFKRSDAAVHLRPGDIVQIEGPVDALMEASERCKARLAHPQTLRGLPDATTGEHVLAEVVVSVDSSLVGATVRSAQIADRYGAIVIGLYRPDRTLFHERLEMLEARLEVGDVLLIQGDRERLHRLQVAESAMILEGAAELPKRALAPVALLIMGTVIAAAALRVVPISISALAGTIAMFATGCLKINRLGSALSAEVIVLVAASIALGDALVQTGAADWLGSGLSTLLGPLPAPAALMLVLAFAALVTNFSSNTAAAAVTTPIAISVAGKLGIPAEAMVLAVLFGSNLAFATPVAYQTNILIMSAGGYRFGDYVRAGSPLVVLMVATLSILLVLWYGI